MEKQRSTKRRNIYQSTMTLVLLSFILIFAADGVLSNASEQYKSPSSKIRTDLEGCRNNGEVNFPPDAVEPLVCPGRAYTRGNLGKGWNDSDLVPHHLRVKNSGTAAETFNVTIAADHLDTPIGAAGYDYITPAYDLSGTCTVGSGALMGGPSLNSCSSNSVYRILTITVPAQSQCVIDWNQRLDIGGNVYIGTSLHSYKFQAADFTRGKQVIALPVYDNLFLTP